MNSSTWVQGKVPLALQVALWACGESCSGAWRSAWGSAWEVWGAEPSRPPWGGTLGSTPEVWGWGGAPCLQGSAILSLGPGAEAPEWEGGSIWSPEARQGPCQLPRALLAAVAAACGAGLGGLAGSGLPQSARVLWPSPTPPAGIKTPPRLQAPGV